MNRQEVKADRKNSFVINKLKELETKRDDNELILKLEKELEDKDSKIQELLKKQNKLEQERLKKFISKKQNPSYKFYENINSSLEITLINYLISKEICNINKSSYFLKKDKELIQILGENYSQYLYELVNTKID